MCEVEKKLAMIAKVIKSDAAERNMVYIHHHQLCVRLNVTMKISNVKTMSITFSKHQKLGNGMTLLTLMLMILLYQGVF